MMRLISSFTLIAALCHAEAITSYRPEDEFSFPPSKIEPETIENQYIISFKTFSFMERATFPKGKAKAKGFQLIRKIRGRNIAVAKFHSPEAADAFKKSQAGKIRSFEPGKERKTSKMDCVSYTHKFLNEYFIIVLKYIASQQIILYMPSLVG